MTLRAETFDDDDGTRTGTAGSYDGLTVTGETRLSQSLLIRGELRFDQADEKVFQDGGRLSDDQTTVALNALYVF